MVVLIMERAPAGLRGELSRWMIEPRAGIFIGKVSAMVRDRLWEKACKGSKKASAMMLYSSQTEQGFAVRTHGDPSRAMIEMEGLTLVHIPEKTRKPNAILITPPVDEDSAPPEEPIPVDDPFA